MNVGTHLQLLVVFAISNQACSTCAGNSSNSAAPPASSHFVYGYFITANQRDIYVQLSTVEECAQFCVQVSMSGIVNCTGFRLDTASGDCLIYSSNWCKQIIDISSPVTYVLKAYNGSHCTYPAVSPSSSIQAAPHSTITYLQQKVDSSSLIEINITTILLDIGWDENLLNSTHSTYVNLTKKIQENIIKIFLNGSMINSATITDYSNHSTCVQAKLSIIFFNNASMWYFRELYKALHLKRTLHSLRVRTISDNLPGKPPTNLSIQHFSDSSAVLTFTHAYHNEQFKTLGYRILYSHSNQTETMVTAYTSTRVKLNLLHLTLYHIVVVSVTKKGFGVQSSSLTTISPKTIETAFHANVTINLKNEEWSDDLQNSTHPSYTSLETRIQNNIVSIYSDQSVVNEIRIVAIRKSNISSGRNSSSSVQVMFSIEYSNTFGFTRLYQAIFNDKRLYNLSVSLVNDNIPGKPVTNLTWTSSSPQRIVVTWSPSPSPQCGYVIFYRQNTSFITNNVTANSSKAILENLLPLTHYVIWVRSITSIGLGIQSDVIFPFTLEKMVQVDIEAAFVNQTWDNETNRQALSQHVNQNIIKLFLNESQFRTTNCTLRNISLNVVAAITVYFGQDVKMGYFSTLYRVFYVQKRIGTFNVHPLRENIPGKPPRTVSATPTGTTSINVTWSLYSGEVSTNWTIHYALFNSSRHSVLTVKGTNYANVSGLIPLTYYRFWIQSLTAWGPGIPSEDVFAWTHEKVLNVKVSTILPTIPWVGSSNHQSNITSVITNNVKSLYHNNSEFRTVVVSDYRKHTDNSTLVDVIIVYGQYVMSREINLLYTAFYKRRKIANLDVTTVSDNLPGKPPSNIIATANTTTSVLLIWNPVPSNVEIKTSNIYVNYTLVSSADNITMVTLQANETSLLVSGLERFQNYTFWVTCATRIGFGISSDPVYVKTLEEYVSIDLVVRFPSLSWTTNLTKPESQDFRQLCQIIKENLILQYDSSQNQLRDLLCNKFRNGSVIGDVSIIYGQNVNMSDFSTLYKALYINGILGNITVQPISDSVPGKPPTNVTLTSSSSTSINITWTYYSATNSTISFLVAYKSSHSNTTQRIMVNSTARHVLISGLQKFTTYVISIASVTIRGAGYATIPVNITTLQDVPSQAPSSLLSYNTSSTSLFIAWGRVPIASIHGILLGYVVQYKKDNNNTSNYTIITADANTRSLNITSLAKFTSYAIQVNAFTVVGWGPPKHVTVSTDEDVPSLPPTNIKARNVSSTAIEVTWMQVPPNSSNGIIKGYNVFYRRANDSNDTYILATTHALQNMTAFLTGLNKFTEYKLKLAAFTSKGNGIESTEMSVYTDEDTPSLPPPNVQAYNTSSTSLKVTWGQIMPTYFVHGILRGYRVLYKQIGDINGSYSNETTLNNSYELKVLNKFTRYWVKVLAFTSKGDGVESGTLDVSTDEDVPSRSPLGLAGHNTTSTSLNITWGPVPHGFLHGILLGYKVLYKIQGDGSVSFTAFILFNSTRNVALTGLSKFTSYVVSVLAFTSKGDGPGAKNITVVTDEDIPSLSPTNVSAHNTSSTSLLINWSPVPKGHVHGILRGYRILFKKDTDVKSDFKNVTSTNRSVTLNGLKKFTVYFVKVLAYTVKGDGPPTHNVSVSTDEDVPSLSPTNVTSHNTSATSLNVTWSDIPSGFVHGILLGYRVHYSIHRRRSERSLEGMVTTVTSPTVQTVVLVGLENYTEYNIEVLGYTRIGDGKKSGIIRVTTDENVPGKPPKHLRGNNASSTSIRVDWDPVPYGFVYGILRGYRVMYRISRLNGSYVNRTYRRETNSTVLSGLLKFTYYDIKILAFTRIGDGIQSNITHIQTDEDTPSMAPQNVQPSNKVSSTTIPLSWSHIPQAFVHGRLRGYHIRYKLIKLSNNDLDDQIFKSLKVPYYETNATLQGLESFSTYEIQIAGFTIKGDGVWTTVKGTTCRCHSVLPVNWFDHPPYVKAESTSNGNESTFDNYTTSIKGIFPPILLAAVEFCCQDCAVESPLHLRKRGYKKEGLLQVKEAINNNSFFNFPIGGIKDQTQYQGHEGIYEFVSIMDMPGAAFLVADRRNIHNEVLFTILGCWPTVIFVVVVAYLAGIVIWMIDVSFNPDDFPKSFIMGSWEGFWWSYITMTTVGYGDRIPKSVPARLFAFVWIWMGIATIAVLTSSITASLMSMVFETQLTLYGTKVAAINSSSEYKLGLRRNADLEVGRTYSNISEIYEDLEKENVHAALLDSYATASQKNLFNKKWLRVRDIIKTGFDSTYGVVLSGDSMKLGQCMRDYMKARKNEISRVVQNNVESITASKVPPAVKRSSDLLTAESDLFKLTATILASMLAVLIALSLLYEYCRQRKIKKKNQERSEKHPEGSWPTWAKLPAKQRYDMTITQYRHDLDLFYKSFKEAHEMLRKKHLQQMKNFHQCKVGLHHFSVSDWAGARSATYTVTQEGDVNSILEGLDLSMFDGKDEKLTKRGL